MRSRVGRWSNVVSSRCATTRSPLATSRSTQHLAARVVAHQGDLREAVDLGEGLGEREKRRVDVGGDAERVGERGECARRHPAGRGVAAGRGGAESCPRRAAKVNHAHADRALRTRACGVVICLTHPPSG